MERKGKEGALRMQMKKTTDQLQKSHWAGHGDWDRCIVTA